jgi:hypothetical protein
VNVQAIQDPTKPLALIVILTLMCVAAHAQKTECWEIRQGRPDLPRVALRKQRADSNNSKHKAPPHGTVLRFEPVDRANPMSHVQIAPHRRRNPVLTQRHAISPKPWIDTGLPRRPRFHLVFLGVGS